MAKDTKNRILEAALTLFAQKGYEATSMAEISEMVGIKAPSFYAHFPSKQALLDDLVEAMRDYFWKSYPSLHTCAVSREEEAELLAKNPSLFMDIAVRTFRFYYQDRYAGVFRRLLSIERYQNPLMDRVYRELYLEAPIHDQAELFSELKKRGYLTEDVDPKIAALEAFSPFLFLINQYDCLPEREEEAIGEITSHVAQFIKRYFH